MHLPLRYLFRMQAGLSRAVTRSSVSVTVPTGASECHPRGLNLEGLCHEYSVAIPDATLIKPEGYTLDAALLARPGNVDIQLDLFSITPTT